METKGSEPNIFSLANAEDIVIDPHAGAPTKVVFMHSKLNRQVSISSDLMDPFTLSDSIVEAVFELTKLNYPSVLDILEDHGFEWGKKEDVDRG